MYENNFGEQLAIARKSKNYTQQQLADYIGVSRQSISSWEMDRTHPDAQTMEKLENLLEMNLKAGEESESGSGLYHYILLVIQAIMVSGFGIYSIRFTQQFGALFTMIVFLICSAVVCVMIGNAVRNKDYAMIAGYDKSRKYNNSVMNKILLAIETVFLVEGIVSTALFIAIKLFFDSSMWMMLISIVMTQYFLAVLLGPMWINYQYKEEIYVDGVVKNDSSNVPTIIYLIQIIGIFVFTIGVFNLYGIQNNSSLALIIAAMIICYCIVISFGFLMKRKNSSVILYRSSIVLSIVIAGLIILTAHLL